MTYPYHLSLAASSYLVNSNLGVKALSAGAEDKNINTILNESKNLVDKARYMDANTNIIQSVKLAFEAGVVGARPDVQFILPSKNPEESKKLNEKAEADFELWRQAEFCEARGMFHFSNCLRQIVKAEKGADGEVLVVHLFNENWKFGYKFKIIEASMIDTTQDREVEYYKTKRNEVKKNAVIGGLEIDEYGMPIGIYVFMDVAKTNSKYFPKGQFSLYFDPHLRISQYRGIPNLSGIIGTIQETMQYKETELMAAEATAKTQNVHKTSLIKPYIEKQISNYKTLFAQKNPNQLTINSFAVESQENSPTVYIDKEDDFTRLQSGNRQSVYESFLKNEQSVIASNYNISALSLLKGDGNAVFSVIKAQKQENETRFSIVQDNLIHLLLVDIINWFIRVNASKWGIKDFYQDEYKYLYKFKVTLGTKTELDEVKSANARKINKQQGVIDDYQAAAQLGNDYDQIQENNTRARMKKADELFLILDKLEELNKKAEKSGMRFILNENNDIILDVDYVPQEEVSEAKIEEKLKLEAYEEKLRADIGIGKNIELLNIQSENEILKQQIQLKKDEEEERVRAEREDRLLLDLEKSMSI
jgi:capsid protein